MIKMYRLEEKQAECRLNERTWNKQHQLGSLSSDITESQNF